MTNATLLHDMDPMDLERLFEAKAEQLMQYNPEKFYGVIIDASMFCRIHQISRTTLQNWIDQEVVIPEGREKNGNLKFRLSEVLKFNVDAIKRRRNKHLILKNHV